ncbi:MAG TPA: hypothetical protein VIE12_03250 [Actinomycetota bacterium]|jgi:hypothetical protein
MSSRIRGRRYRNIDPDERYGFTQGPSGTSAGSAATPSDGSAIIAIGPVFLQDTSTDGTAVTMDGTTVRVEPPDVVLPSDAAYLDPRAVTGPSQTEG